MNQISTTCPTCNQPLPPTGLLFIDPYDDSISVNGAPLKLTPYEREMLLSLWERRPRVVSNMLLMDDLYGLEQDWPDQKNHQCFRL